MSRFNTKGHRAKPAVATTVSPLGTISAKAPDARTFEGGAGWTKNAKADLFLRASASLNDGGNKFYETGYERDAKLRELARQVAVEDFTWFAQFVQWLRRTANIRTSAIMVAADGVKARLDAGLHGVVGADVPHPDSVFFVPTNRFVIDSVLYRADEPGEMLAYWMNQYGRRIPKPVKRGVADAVRRLYTQRSLLKYDTASHAVRFADVLNLAHPAPAEKIINVREVVCESGTFAECPTPQKSRFAVAESAPSIGKDGTVLYAYACQCGWYHSSSRAPAPWDVNEFREVPVVRYERVPVRAQKDLFQHALDRRYGHDVAIPESLGIVHANFALREDLRIESWLNPEFLNKAGMTWEDALSAVGSTVDKAKLWEAMIPSMGYMALLRNLRNFDEAGVSNKVAQSVIEKLVDPEEVAKSRQLPFRFYSAYKNAPSLRWAYALETALDLSLSNIPVFGGRTLVLIDTSASMRSTVSDKSKMTCVEAAALFGTALSVKNQGSVDLHHFATNVQQIGVPPGGSVLKLTDQVCRLIGTVGHGTEMAMAINRTYTKHDRIILLSDGQAAYGQAAYARAGSVASRVPDNVPVYVFNIEGYSASPMPTGSAARFDLGGMSDQTFKLIPLLEQGRGNAWPWEV